MRAGSCFFGYEEALGSCGMRVGRRFDCGAPTVVIFAEACACWAVVL